jgi:hypothetical protein
MPPKAGQLARRVEPIYGPPLEGGEIVLYAGDLEVYNGEQTATLHGQIELRLFPTSDLKARVAGSGIDLFRLIGASDTQATALPADAVLDPPEPSTLPDPPPANTEWAESWIDAQGLTGGDLDSAERLLVHYTGALDPLIRHLTDLEGGGSQGQISFELPGWSLVLAPIPKDDRLEGGFAGAIEATPTDGHLDPEEVNRVAYCLFAILSLIATREVAIGPVCGLDSSDRVVWARWDAPRMRLGHGIGWCPRALIPTALPALAAGYASLIADRALVDVIERAIEALLFADSGEVLDVRIPIACIGIELVAWAVLPRWTGVDETKADKLNAGPAARLLLEWADIPTGIPDELPALTARRDALNQRGWGGPEILFNVRNRLVHPPKSRDDPEWPDHDVMVEAWQLATWYLQLAILRLLDYHGHYRTALVFGGSEARSDPVPWAEANASK